MTLAENPLRDLGDGGVGFCYDFDRELFAGAGDLVDGPLLLGLDSNVLFDLATHGGNLIDGVDLVGVEPGQLPDIEAIGSLMEAWFARDIRFVLLPTTWTDFKNEPTPEKHIRRRELFSAVEDALSFQLQDWNHTSFDWDRPLDDSARETLARVSDPLDRAMVESAWLCGVDVFVTSDVRLGRLASTPAGFPNVWFPRELDRRLPESALPWELGGTVPHAGCLWDGEVIFGDMGKVGRLLSALG